MHHLVPSHFLLASSISKNKLSINAGHERRPGVRYRVTHRYATSEGKIVLRIVHGVCFTTISGLAKVRGFILAGLDGDSPKLGGRNLPRNSACDNGIASLIFDGLGESSPVRSFLRRADAELLCLGVLNVEPRAVVFFFFGVEGTAGFNVEPFGTFTQLSSIPDIVRLRLAPASTFSTSSESLFGELRRLAARCTSLSD